MIVLQGMTWDHARGYDSVQAVSREFSARYPDIQLHWDARSLKDFEDFPVQVLARQYDLMMIDHPHIGDAVAASAFEPMDDWIDADFLHDQRVNSVGPGYATYTWQGRQWALSADEAAQVCAYRPDALDAMPADHLPRTWDEVLRFAAALPPAQRMGLPLVPTHAFSCFVTLNANIGGPDFWQGETSVRLDSGREACAILQKLAAAADPRSFDMNPIQMLDAMTAHTTTGASLVYSPLIYGYSNYSRQSYRDHIVCFADIPSAVREPRGSMIGGVGIAVSSSSAHKQQAMHFVRHLVSAACQTGTLYLSGGQPGYMRAWHDDAINADCNNFFRNTLRTLELSYVRPRRPGYCLFQQKAGEFLRDALLKKTTPAAMVDGFNALFSALVVQTA